MKLQHMLPFRSFIVAFAIICGPTNAEGADGLYESYCSSENTGSDYAATTNIWNSEGSCKTQCEAGYAFAVMQYQQCWCSNYIPASQLSVSNCNQTCPGWMDDRCGNLDRGLYGYLALDKSPSGTAGASSAQASSTATPTTHPTSTQQTSTSQAQPTSYVSTTIVETVTQSPDPSVIISYSYIASTSSPSPSSSPSSTSTPSTISVAPVPVNTETSATPSPVTSVQVVTVSGAIVTHYVTSTPLAASGDNNHPETIQRKEGVSAGAIAGIVIGILAGFALLAVGAFFLWRRKKNGADAEKTNAAAGTTTPAQGPKRNMSILSKSGLLVRGRPGTAEPDDDPWNNATGNNSVRHSMLFGAGAEVSPVSPLGSSQDGDSRRHSRPHVYDHRLNPSALFANHEANGSRVSMQDAEDYTRPLGVRNPDAHPRASFSSR